MVTSRPGSRSELIHRQLHLGGIDMAFDIHIELRVMRGAGRI